MGLQGTVIMRDMHRSTYIDVLVSFMGQAIFTAFGFCILTLLGFFVDRGPIYASIWFSVAVIASLAFIRVILLLLKILHFASTEEPRGGAGLAG
jgi:heme/copper-type cytochrome/quinol oxidase subunit 4